FRRNFDNHTSHYFRLLSNPEFLPERNLLQSTKQICFLPETLEQCFLRNLYCFSNVRLFLPYRLCTNFPAEFFRQFFHTTDFFDKDSSLFRLVSRYRKSSKLQRFLPVLRIFLHEFENTFVGQSYLAWLWSKFLAPSSQITTNLLGILARYI